MARSRDGALSLGRDNISRQLISQPAVIISIFVAVLIASFLLSAAPLLLERVSAEDLHATVSDPTPAQRNIRVEGRGHLGGSPEDPLAPVRRLGESFADSEFPPSIAAIISGSGLVVDSPRFFVDPMPGDEPPHPFPMYLRYRYQDGIEEHITLVEGELPASSDPTTTLVGSECPTDPVEVETLLESLRAGGPGQTGELDCRLEEVPVYEVAVSAATAEALGLEIGRPMLLTPDPTDRLLFGISGEALDYRMVMSISGIIRLSDPSEEYWYGEMDLHRPAIQENADLRIIRATGLISPGDYVDMVETTGEAGGDYTWRHFVDPDLVVESDVETLLADLQSLELDYSTEGAGPADFSVITQLSALLSNHLEQKSQTVAMLSLAVVGTFAVVVAVVLLLAVLMTARQSRTIVLARNRGASPGQLTLTRFYEAFLLVTPAAIFGYLAAVLLLGGEDSLASYRSVVALSAATVAMMVASVVPLSTRRLGALQRTGDVTPHGSPRRVVLDITILVLAVGSVLVLRRRGQLDDPAPASFDLLLALTPVLIGLAVALVTIRLYPLAIRLMSWLGSKSRGLVAFVGFRRILQQPTAARIPVAVILICVATGTFAAITRTSILTGQVESSWQVVGADFAVKGLGPHVNLPTSIDLGELAPAGSSVFGKSFADARVVVDTANAATHVLAIDAVGYERLTRGTPGDPALPGFMSEPPSEDAGTESAPLPVIVSRIWPAEVELDEGDVFTLDLGGIQPVAIVAEVRNRYPDVPADRPFVILSLPALQSISAAPLPPTVAYLRGSEASGSRLAADLAAQSTSARLTSRYEILNDIADDPFVHWAQVGLLVVFAFSAVFAVVAGVSSLALSSARRRHDFAYLRTVGLATGQAASMTVIEQLPAVAVGTLVGVLVGVASARVLDPAIELGGFTGGVVPSSVVIDWSAIVVMTAVLLGAMATAIVSFVLMSRHEDLGRMLRVGDEP